MSTWTYPDVTDPVLVSADDRTIFVCWVEREAGALQWVFVSAHPPVRYAGPAYSGETSMDAIRALVNGWWTARATRSKLTRA